MALVPATRNLRPFPPRHAFILAAGLSTRLRPLTDLQPKPLLPFWGRPILLRTLEVLQAWGVREVLVNVHHAAGPLVELLRTAPVPGLEVAVSFEPTILGTGGALARGRWFFGTREPFWVVNGDIVFDLDPRSLVRALARPRTVAAAWMIPDQGPRTVEVVKGCIRSFHAVHPGGPGTSTFAGLQLVSPRIFDFLPFGGDERFSSILDAYKAAMAAGHRVAGMSVPGAFWADLGTPAQFIEAHRAWHVRRPKDGCPRPSALKARGMVSVNPGVTAARGARAEDSVIMSGVRLERGADVRHAIVGPGVTVRGVAPYLDVRATDLLTAAEARAMGDAGVRPADAEAVLFEPRGSDRSFARVRDARRSAMLVRYGTARPENARYAGHTRFLRRHGLPVPALFADGAGQGFVIMEDVGDRALEGMIQTGATSAQMRRWYRRVIGAVAQWHDPALARAASHALELEAGFGPALYAREHELFLEQFARRMGGASAAACRGLKRELANVARKLGSAPRVLVHRDLQSSNILWTRRGPRFIDFQGMRLGPAMYDMASLLCDPYVELPLDLQMDLLEEYAWATGPWARPDLFWCAAVQRVCQALGAYGRLASLPGASRWARYVPAGVRMLRRALEQGGEPMPALTAAALRWSNQWR